MSWRKYFTPVEVNNQTGTYSPLGGRGRPGPARMNYSSFLPDVYAGAPNRIERYMQYDTMDMDPEVNAALDIITEFCTQKNTENQTPFNIYFRGHPSSTETRLIKEALQKWCRHQQLETRIFRIVRNSFKYGDCFFLRDPETKKWLYVDPAKVSKIIANESEGKIPEQYVIRDINFNFQNLVAVTPHGTSNTAPSGTSSYTSGGGFGRGMVGNAAQPPGTRFQNQPNEVTVDADNVVHMSMSEGLDDSYPFGRSLLESVFKVYKQKELLEDAIVIYRIQRAPERRVFYVDVGNMPAHMAMSFVERVKNEIQQRRIPSSTGGGQNVIDASYNPLSTNEDFFFPQTCLSLDTEIKLLDDRSLTVQDIIREYNQGKTNYTYTVNQKTHEIEPGKIVWAGITRKNAQVVKVTLDNGKTITCTPDHRFIMRDGSEVEAQHLEHGSSVMPLYLHDARTSKHQGSNRYLRYTCPATNKKKWVHTTICPKTKPGKETEIHHIDCNSRNNNPDNLIEMDTAAHRQLHKELGSYNLITAWSNDKKRQILLDGIRNYHKNATADDKLMFAERGKINGANTWKNKESAKRVLKALEHTRSKVSKAKTIQISDNMCNRLVELYNNGYNSISKLVIQLRKDEVFQKEFRKANKNLLRDKNLPDIMLPTDTSLRKMAIHMGYANWRDFKESYAQNHKIVSVEWMDEPIDTGDITIESASGSHNFALTAGIFVHNSEGRGSKVETLPGASNLGEITDLRYFTNKLFRALRIPASYLPTAIEEAPAVVADGKVGTAYIQELRFNEYCKRLQNTLVGVFDTEFKLWLHYTGINIDSSLFELKFNSPQNFAAYRQAELDSQRAALFAQMQDIPYLSKRFAMKRYLGMTAEEIAENELMWREENGQPQQSTDDAASQMRGVGITPSGIGADLGMQDAEAPDDMADAADPAAETGGAPPPPEQPS